MAMPRNTAYDQAEAIAAMFAKTMKVIEPYIQEDAKERVSLLCDLIKSELSGKI
jgi:hypothetical protein